MEHIAETIVAPAAGDDDAGGLYVRASVHANTLVVRATDMMATTELPPPGVVVGDSAASDPRRFGRVFEARWVQGGMCEVNATGVLSTVRAGRVRIVSTGPSGIQLHLGAAAGTRTLRPAVQAHSGDGPGVPISAEARLYEQLCACLLQQKRSNRALATSLEENNSTATSNIAELRGLVTSLRSDLRRTQRMLDEARTGAFDAVAEASIPLDQTTTVEQTLSLTGVPADASAVLVSFYSRSGSEPPSKEYCVSVWSTAGGSRHIHRVFRYQQNAISFDNEVVWFPLAPGQTTLKAQLDAVPPATNRHDTVLRIRGFRAGRAFSE